MQESVLQDLTEFIAASPSPYHAVAEQAARLEAAGFRRLTEARTWSLESGQGYYVTRNESSLIAFRLPSRQAKRFMMTASHTDAPTLKLKDVPELPAVNGVKRLNVEGYGSALLLPWFDRPLGVAGRVAVRTEQGVELRLYASGRPLAMIPSLAIHMDRDANHGHDIVRQKEIVPIYALADAPDLLTIVAKDLGLGREEILAHDLMLYNTEPPRVWGAQGEFFSAEKLDDLACVYASLAGILSARGSDSIPVHIALDNEEIGSSTMQGACGTFVRDTLMRIAQSIGWTEQDYLAAVAKSFLLSADNAHAAHPNHMDRADPVTHPRMNGGPVVKFSGAQTYATDAVSAAVVRRAAELAGIELQSFVNHSDVRGGRTLGNIFVQQVSAHTADVGIAQLAMHSPYETCGSADIEALAALCGTIYSTALCEDVPGRFTVSVS